MISQSTTFKVHSIHQVPQRQNTITTENNTVWHTHKTSY